MYLATSENTDVLTYIDGKYLFREVTDSKTRMKLSQSSYWTSVGNDTYSTKELRAAAPYRDFADERLKKYFDKTFQARYKLPKLPPLPLDPHQWEGLKWILTRKRSYLAHAPGAGKTAQAIVAASITESPGQTLFIVPPALTLNWQRECEKFLAWTGDFGKVVIVPKTKDRESMDWSADYVILPDSMLGKWWVYANLIKRQWKLIAVDEASRFKEPTSGRSLMLYGGSSEDKEFKGIYRNARHVVLMDGSPMPNRPRELWAPVYALDPETIDCMSYDEFGYRYCGAKPNERGVWEYNYSSNEDELRQKLRKSFMHVVTEDELSHPERLRSMLVMSHDVRSLEQKEWERRTLPKLRISGDDSKGDIARFRRELGVRKIPWVVRYIRDLEEKNQSILLFAWHREVCLTLAKELGCLSTLVMGGTDPEIREAVFKAFNEKKITLIVANVAVASRGFNLQAADRVVFAEFSWTDEVNRQAEKRASRRGSEKEFVRCDYIVCPDSIDEMVVSSLFTKEKRVKRVIG